MALLLQINWHVRWDCSFSAQQHPPVCGTDLSLLSALDGLQLHFTGSEPKQSLGAKILSIFCFNLYENANIQYVRCMIEVLRCDPGAVKLCLWQLGYWNVYGMMCFLYENVFGRSTILVHLIHRHANSLYWEVCFENAVFAIFTVLLFSAAVTHPYPFPHPEGQYWIFFSTLNSLHFTGYCMPPYLTSSYKECIKIVIKAYNRITVLAIHV